MARPRITDPRRLDVYKFAEAGAELEGEIAQASLARLGASLSPHPGDATAVPVRWHAVGEQRTVAAGAPEVWLHLRAGATVTLECQRCLRPLAEPLAVDRWFRFVTSEDEAARLDEDCEDDVLVASSAFDLQELLEDELILALPIVPRHGVCPNPLPVPAADDEAQDEAPNPFAALAALRRPD